MSSLLSILHISISVPSQPLIRGSIKSGFDTEQLPSRPGSSQYTDSGYREKSKSPEWDAVLAAMAAEIKVRHYSRKTLKNIRQLVPTVSTVS